MLLQNIPVFCLHLLLFLHTSRSFVLLTANIDDVKKIAKKFVSESLADKIASFIAKAAENIAHGSEEVRKDVSEENRNYNVRETSSVEQDFDAHKKKSKKHHHKKSKKNFEEDSSSDNYRSSQHNTNGKNEFSVPRANSIEDNKVDDKTLNKTINAVFDLNLKAEKDEGHEKRAHHHKNSKVQLLATSGNMVLTRVVNSKEVTESAKIDKENGEI